MIADYLIKHSRHGSISFHMPGHKGIGLYHKYGYGDFLDRIMSCDITEIAGADNLFQAEGIIRETMDRYRELYHVKQSYLLVNGSSAGIIAAVMAAVPRGGRLIMARNCHKAVYHGLTLGGVKPIYAYPKTVSKISGPISVAEIETLILQNQDAAAVILPSPNYYGVCSDIKGIADVCHKYHKILIVDQAHGAHLKFFSDFALDHGFPKSAEECGADIIINSIHKTLASFTQSAVLHLNSDRVDRYVLEDKLQMIQSSSPSYLLTGSLDINAVLLKRHGSELITAWAENVAWFYQQASALKEIRILKPEAYFDRTKINIDASAYGLDGAALEAYLQQKNIYAELTTGNILMCMTGIGNSRKDMECLLQALEEITYTYIRRENLQNEQENAEFLWSHRHKMNPIPERKIRVPLEQSAGRICAVSVIPYPPGIPLLCPGEEITALDIEYIKELRSGGEKVIGINDLEEVTVGE